MQRGKTSALNKVKIVIFSLMQLCKEHRSKIELMSEFIYLFTFLPTPIQRIQFAYLLN
jgi:hypothetical protein